MKTKKRTTQGLPKDLTKFPDFVKKNNLPIDRSMAFRMRQDPAFPAGFKVTPKVILYSESSLVDFIASRIVKAGG